MEKSIVGLVAVMCIVSVLVVITVGVFILKKVFQRKLSLHKEHEFLLKMENAGLNDALSQKVIESKNNGIAKRLIEYLKTITNTASTFLFVKRVHLASEGFLKSDFDIRVALIDSRSDFRNILSKASWHIKPFDEVDTIYGISARVDDSDLQNIFGYYLVYSVDQIIAKTHAITKAVLEKKFTMKNAVVVGCVDIENERFIVQIHKLDSYTFTVCAYKFGLNGWGEYVHISVPLRDIV